MQLEIDPTPVRSRPALPVLIVVAATLGVVAFALLAGNGPGPVDRSPAALVGRTSPTPERAPASSATAAAPVAPPDALVTWPPAVLPPPDAIDCHALGASACAAIALASVSRLPPDERAVTSIGAWPSLLCSDESDCPRSRLAGNRPLGSAIVTTGSGTEVWVNVLQRGPAAEPSGQPAAGGAGAPARTIAWIIRWQP